MVRIYGEIGVLGILKEVSIGENSTQNTYKIY